MHKPWQTLFYAMLFFLLLAVIAWLFPAGGIKTGGPVLRFPDLYTLFEKPHPKKDISKILMAATAAEDTSTQGLAPDLSDASNSRDTSFIIQGAPETQARLRKRDSAVALITSIQYRNISALSDFFESLGSLLTNTASSVRVLHYGDSQIEGDRITDWLRLKMQGQFGGAGPGLISLMPLSSSVINRIETGPFWERYSCGTAKDKRVAHSNYGPMASFVRFRSYRRIYDTTSAVTASVTISTTQSGGKSAMQYKKLKLYYGGAQRKTWCEFYDGPALVAADSLQKGGVMNTRQYQVGQGSFTHTLRFRSKDSPDFYGISLETDHGIKIDNIALRGSSGTFFHLINPDQLGKFYSELNVRLVVLQFGGNALPFLSSDTMVANYASWLRGQINILRRIRPGINILFIGPADMSVKEGTEYVTHPYLEPLRDALKKMAFDANCAFFDMYDCMGGKNSMASWVEARLAASDYIHFSPQGARKVAALLHTALMAEYEKYRKK